ncbi:MAG: T9SS type A sorting domain-containing protein, partial [Rubricoccaceae bacterium]|nr:T9SS type A sorting domain-containing protein [Rubricoccaceae bacterium]
LPLAVEVWAEVEGPGVAREVFGPVPLTLGPGEARRRVLSLWVPAQAPAGSYTVRLRAGDHDGGAWVWSVISTGEASFEKEAGAAPRGTEAPGAGDWSVSGWHAGAAASGGLGVSVWPNPVRGEATVRVTLPEPSEASVALFDVLGRRVGVLHEGLLGAGDHAFGLDTRGLPAGVYVVRVGAGGAVASRRATVLR